MVSFGEKARKKGGKFELRSYLVMLLQLYSGFFENVSEKFCANKKDQHSIWIKPPTHDSGCLRSENWQVSFHFLLLELNCQHAYW